MRPGIDLILRLAGRTLDHRSRRPGFAGRALVRRLGQLYTGLVICGIGMGLVVRAHLGLDPWNVLHQGLHEHSNLAMGTISIIVGGFVLLAWIPLRQRIGFGTVSNIIVIGVVLNQTLDLVAEPSALPVRWACLVGGTVMCGIGSGAYIGVGMGPGPRDGLMTGLHQKGLSIRVARTGLELSALGLGFLLGGSVGVGTVVFALGIGPLVHVFLPRLTVARPERAREPAAAPPVG